MDRTQDTTNPERRRAWLGLARSAGVGSVAIDKLLERFDPEQIFSASPHQLSQTGISDKQIQSLREVDWDLVEQDLRWLEEANNDLMTLDDPDYPALLREIPQPPAYLFLKGNRSLLNCRQIAIVGSRNPSQLGVQTAHAFARALVNCGFVVTSGLALGIDAASHQGALQGGGFTIAVTGTGLDRVYPACHKDLATEIVEHGLLVSEFPPGTKAKAGHFPRRNRIISGLCEGLLVVEAAQQSGSLITAGMALEQNREVFAIPGSIHNPLARGCNALIRQGAKLVETVEDVLEELGHINQITIPNPTTEQQTLLDLEQQSLLNLIAYSATSVDELVQASGLNVEAVSSMLLMLELQGLISPVAGGGYQRV